MSSEFEHGQFESRKQDHIRIALSAETQTPEHASMDSVELVHEALPEINFSEVQLSQPFFDREANVPYFVSSMTAGHLGALAINRTLARVAAQRGWAMGVGSQRRELADPEAVAEWRQIRREVPKAVLIGNLGLAEVIKATESGLRRLVENLAADAFFIHLNPLQECLQAEGNPEYRGGLAAIERAVKALSVPVVVKETGCGLSEETLNRLRSTGIAAVDVAGLGGTHWGRVEGQRQQKGHLLYNAAQTFGRWGIPTIQSVAWATQMNLPFEIWASGGIRNGLDAGKLLALGANRVGIAQPLLAAALEGETQLDRVMEQFEFELKIALFCTGCARISDWKQKRVWRWSSLDIKI